MCSHMYIVSVGLESIEYKICNYSFFSVFDFWKVFVKQKIFSTYSTYVYKGDLKQTFRSTILDRNVRL